jgi:hypothetical protein
LVLVFLVLGTGCADEGKAETDLPDEKIATQLGATDVIVNADRFPNFAHTCWTDEGNVVGFWSTTDRVTIIVYNDWLCPGSTKEQPMTVLSGNPRDVVNAS